MLTGAGDTRSADACWSVLAETGGLLPPYTVTAARPLPDNLHNTIMVRLQLLSRSLHGICSRVVLSPKRWYPMPSPWTESKCATYAACPQMMAANDTVWEGVESCLEHDPDSIDEVLCELDDDDTAAVALVLLRLGSQVGTALF